MRLMENAIVVENVTKRFGTVQALKGISFEVPEATVFGLLGPNGAGKTTAIRILSTILAPDSGTATVLGFDVAKSPDDVRLRIGLAGQFAAVDPNLTGRENLWMTGRLAQLTGKDASARAVQLLERFNLIEAADRPIRTYSGGMRRRLDVAASLVARPPVVYLDEPTTGLDLHSRNGLWDTIRELVAEGTTVLLTTQYLEEADQLAARLAVIDGGMVIANDTPTALKHALGNTVIEMGIGTDDRAARAQSVLAGVLPAAPDREGSVVRISSDEGARILIDALRRLENEGLTPATLTVREPSLDDVFLVLTGHRAEEAPAPGANGNGKRGRRGRRGGQP
ncbi:MAG TPA: ATP-binding cassette domain-containing protein [Actinomycetota bacterium]|nr:ATP-binding cassette domain-containing protein [Actinomycetota bacterium]